MVAKKLINDVLALPVADRIEVFETLWDNLRSDPDASPLRDEQRHILDGRIAEHEANPDEGSTWEEVESRILRMLDERRIQGAKQ